MCLADAFIETLPLINQRSFLKNLIVVIEERCVEGRKIARMHGVTGNLTRSVKVHFHLAIVEIDMKEFANPVDFINDGIAMKMHDFCRLRDVAVVLKIVVEHIE